MYIIFVEMLLVFSFFLSSMFFSAELRLHFFVLIVYKI